MPGGEMAYRCLMWGSAGHIGSIPGIKHHCFILSCRPRNMRRSGILSTSVRRWRCCITYDRQALLHGCNSSPTTSTEKCWGLLRPSQARTSKHVLSKFSPHLHCTLDTSCWCRADGQLRGEGITSEDKDVCVQMLYEGVSKTVCTA